MTTNKKHIVFGATCIVLGIIVSYRADKLTILRNGVQRPNEGGYIRSKAFGLMSISIGTAFLGYGIYKIK